MAKMNDIEVRKAMQAAGNLVTPRGHTAPVGSRTVHPLGQSRADAIASRRQELTSNKKVTVS